MANANATQLQQLYIAYFGRAADPSGLDYWVDKGTTTKAFAANMYSQDEFTDVNEGLTTALQINQIYQNLFGRDADADGLMYWVGQVDNGKVELASIAINFIYSVNDGSNADDLAALNNKTAAAEAFTEDVRNDNQALLAYQPKSKTPYVVGTNFETTKTFFKTVTATNSVTDAEVQAEVDSIAANTANIPASENPTYSLSTSATTVNEGATLTTSVSTTGVDEGTTLYYSLSGTGVTSADLSSGDLLGAGTVDSNGDFTISHTIASDLATEGTEEINIKLFSDSYRTNQVGSTSIVTVADSSTTPAPDPTTFDLTTGVDTPTAGDHNKFDASLNSAGNQTLNSLDQLKGTSSSGDVLNATISRSVTPLLIKDIETVNVGATAAATLGLVNSTGVTNVNIGGVTGGAFTVKGITSAADFSITDSDQSHTITFNDVSGTADSADITVAQLYHATVTSLDLTVAGVETINLVSAGGDDSNKFALVATALETLTVTGSGDIELSNFTTETTDSLSKIDFSGYTGASTLATGALDISLTDLTVLGGSGNDSIDTSAFISGDTSIDGGAGNDTITIALATTDTLVGGEGTDTLSTSSRVATAGNVSGFETLEITGAVTQDMDNLSGNTWDTINFGGNVATTVENAAADIATIVLNTNSQDTKTFTRKTDTTSDTIAVTLANTSASNLSIADEETINITSIDAASTVTTLTGTDATKVTIAGSENTTVTNFAGIYLATLDASAATGVVSFANTSNTSEAAMTVTAGAGGLTTTGSTQADTMSGAAGADSLTGGSGNDSITGAAGNDSLLGGAGDDTVSGGVGNDSITADGGDDSLTGGAGNDTFVLAANWDSNDTIDGGDGTDTLTLTAAGATTTLTGVSNLEQIEFTQQGADTLALADATSINKITIVDLSTVDSTHTVTGIQSGATVVYNQTEDDNLTLDTVDGATLTLENKADTTGGSVTITDAATVNIIGKAASSDLTALVLDDVDTTVLNLSTTSTHDLDTGNITGTDKVQTVTLTTDTHNGALVTGTIADGDSVTSLTATGVGGDITTTGLFGTGTAEGLATVTLTATEGSDISIGAVTADKTDSPDTENSLTVTASANGTATNSDVSSVAIAAISNNQGSLTLNFSGEKQVNSTGTDAGSSITVTRSGSGASTIAALDSTTTLTATHTGSGALTISSFDAEGDVTIDSSAASGALTVNSTTFTHSATVTGGSGADTLTMDTAAGSGKVHSVVGGAGNDTLTGSSGAETLEGGDGQDSLVGAAGNDNISGGAGNDTFNFMTSGNLTKNDTVDGGAGTDTANITTAVTINDSVLTNIEFVDLELTATGKTVDAGDWTSLSKLTLGGTIDGNTDTISNIKTGVEVVINDNDNDIVSLDYAAGADATVSLNVAMATSLVLTDAATVTINNATSTVANSSALVLDATDTTALTVNASSSGTTATGNITNTNKLETVTVTTAATTGTATLGTIADADALTSVTITALNANAEIGQIGTDATANNAETLTSITATATGTGITATLGAIYLDSSVDSNVDNALVLTTTANTGAQVIINAIDNTYGTITETAVSHSTNNIDHDNAITSAGFTATISGGGHTEYDGKLDQSGAVSITSTSSGNVLFADIDADGTSASVNLDGSGASGSLKANAKNTTVSATMTGGSGADSLIGGSTHDSITGGDGNDTLLGQAGNDTITGGEGADSITGGAGNDSITGGDGNDTLIASGGFDTVNGGAGNDTFTFAANMSLSDSVDGGDGTDTITAQLSAATANQKIGTVSNVENITLDFAQTGGSFSATGGSFTTITANIDDDSDDATINNITSAMTVKIMDGAKDYEAIALDYADDATANIQFGDTNTVGATDTTITITDAQTVNITSIGGSDTTVDNITVDAADTDYVTIASGANDSGFIMDTFAGVLTQTVSVTTTHTDSHIELGVIGTDDFLASATKLTSLTVSAGGDTSSDIQIADIGETASKAASALETITVTAADEAQVLIGIIDAAAATLTSITATASTSGSTINFDGIITAASVTSITASAVSGATVDFDEDVDITTIGTISLTGAGTHLWNDAGSAITTLEQISAGGTSGTVTIDMTSLTGATTFTLGSGTNTLVVGAGNDTVNLADGEGTDTVKMNTAGSITTIYNFETGSSGDTITLDLSGLNADISGGTVVDIDENDKDAGATSTTAVTYYSVDEGAVDFDNATANANILVLNDTLSGDLDTALEVGGDYVTTTTDSITGFESGDAIMVLWSDGEDTMLSTASIGTTRDNAIIQAGDLTVANVLVFKGVTDANDIVAGQFNTIIT